MATFNSSRHAFQYLRRRGVIVVLKNGSDVRLLDRNWIDHEYEAITLLGECGASFRMSGKGYWICGIKVINEQLNIQ